MPSNKTVAEDNMIKINSNVRWYLTHSRQTSDSQNSLSGWRTSLINISCFSKLFIWLLRQTYHNDWQHWWPHRARNEISTYMYKHSTIKLQQSRKRVSKTSTYIEHNNTRTASNFLSVSKPTQKRKKVIIKDGNGVNRIVQMSWQWVLHYWACQKPQLVRRYYFKIYGTRYKMFRYKLQQWPKNTRHQKIGTIEAAHNLANLRFNAMK